MSNPNREARDEMNLATLPIALLGRNDTRQTIEYYGTYYDGKKQQSMVWTVSGAANVGLPSEFAERVLVALLYLGSQTDFDDRRLEFTPYQILKVLGQSFSGRNYQAIELALAQLKGVTVTSDKAWIEKKKDGSQKRVTSKRGFNIIDEYYLRSDDDGEDEDGSFIVWGSRIWKNLQAGYIRRLDIDFYYSIELPLARRLFRFLDKMTNYKPGAPYEIDIFDLANKLGLAHYQYAAHLKRYVAAAANELIERDYLARCEFFKTGKYTRARFVRRQAEQLSLFETTLETIDKTITILPANDPLAALWASIVAISPRLEETKLLSIENGTAIVKAGFYRDWIKSQLSKKILAELQREAEGVTAVVFVE